MKRPILTKLTKNPSNNPQTPQKFNFLPGNSCWLHQKLVSGIQHHPEGRWGEGDYLIKEESFVYQLDVKNDEESVDGLAYCSELGGLLFCSHGNIQLFDIRSEKVISICSAPYGVHCIGCGFGYIACATNKFFHIIKISTKQVFILNKEIRGTQNIKIMKMNEKIKILIELFHKENEIISVCIGEIIEIEDQLFTIQSSYHQKVKRSDLLHNYSNSHPHLPYQYWNGPHHVCIVFTYFQRISHISISSNEEKGCVQNIAFEGNALPLEGVAFCGNRLFIMFGSFLFSFRVLGSIPLICEHWPHSFHQLPHKTAQSFQELMLVLRERVRVKDIMLIIVRLCLYLWPWSFFEKNYKWMFPYFELQLDVLKQINK